MCVCVAGVVCVGVWACAYTQHYHGVLYVAHEDRKSRICSPKDRSKKRAHTLTHAHTHTPAQDPADSSDKAQLLRASSALLPQKDTARENEKDTHTHKARQHDGASCLSCFVRERAREIQINTHTQTHTHMHTHAHAHAHTQTHTHTHTHTHTQTHTQYYTMKAHPACLPWCRRLNRCV